LCFGFRLPSLLFLSDMRFNSVVLFLSKNFISLMCKHLLSLTYQCFILLRTLFHENIVLLSFSSLFFKCGLWIWVKISACFLGFVKLGWVTSPLSVSSRVSQNQEHRDSECWALKFWWWPRVIAGLCCGWYKEGGLRSSIGSWICGVEGTCRQPSAERLPPLWELLSGPSHSFLSGSSWWTLVSS
jgi:hypothetical protein